VSKDTATNVGLYMPLLINPNQPWTNVSINLVLGLPIEDGERE
jgi:hypothetical protein